MTATRVAVAIVASALSACGSPGNPAAAGGYWLPLDGGPGAIVFVDRGEHLWTPHRIVFTRMAVDATGQCSYERLASGELRYTGPTISDPAQRRLAADADGGWTLHLAFPDALVDSQYKSILSNEPSKIVGTVRAAFTGSMALEGAQAVRIRYQVEYRDAEKLLSTETGDFVAPRADTCR